MAFLLLVSSFVIVQNLINFAPPSNFEQILRFW